MATVEPPVEPAAAAKLRRSFFQRYRDGRGKNPLQNAFGTALSIAMAGTVAAPVLWGAAPAMKIAYALTAALLLMLIIILPLIAASAAWRKLGGKTRTASKPPPSRPAKLTTVAVGALLGVGLSIGAYHATGPVAERAQTYLDRNSAPEKQERVRWISGGAVEDETIQVLSRNPIGREILDKLRDRGGVIRLPTFFLSHQDDSYASHNRFYDGVYLDENEVTKRDWTVEQFLGNPALQRRLIREMNAWVFHELVHAAQKRRPPWTPGYFEKSTEVEQEAFFRQILYLVAQLETGEIEEDNGQWMIAGAADDLDAYLKFIADMYPKNALADEPYFNAFLAEQRAHWPVERVRIYRLLAERATSPGLAKMYANKAKAAAAEAGLPEPIGASR